MEEQNNTEAILTPEEQIQFRQLTNKILNTEFSLILSFTEKESLLKLLARLDTLSQTSEANGSSTPSANETQPINNLNIIARVFSFMAFMAISLALVGIPMLIILYITGSLVLTISTIIITSIAYILLLALAALVGKMNWGLLFISASSLIVIAAITFLVLLQIFYV